MCIIIILLQPHSIFTSHSSPVHCSPLSHTHLVARWNLRNTLLPISGLHKFGSKTGSHEILILSKCFGRERTNEKKIQWEFFACGPVERYIYAHCLQLAAPNFLLVNIQISRSIKTSKLCLLPPPFLLPDRFQFHSIENRIEILCKSREVVWTVRI